jgi:hypothetical protein
VPKVMSANSLVISAQTNPVSSRARGNHEPAGKRESGRRRHANQHLQPVLVEAAWSAVRHTGYPRSLYHRHLTKNGGCCGGVAKKKAIVAVEVDSPVSTRCPWSGRLEASRTPILPLKGHLTCLSDPQSHVHAVDPG